ncbi:MAG TPA: thioredoxin-disulfide reductase, partial [Firmicutes bacterium]|nr:thioredoxin-disulfide reductase [Bacillota bacterium]
MANEFDVIVIGAGIAGISAAIYLKRSSLSFLLLDKGMVGGKLNYIHKIDNYPGFSSIAGIELSLSLQRQMKQLNIESTYGEVNKIEKKDNIFQVRTDSDTYKCKATILASGSSEQRLGIKGEKEFFGKGVSYCATC